jgi:hypothetical protein
MLYSDFEVVSNKYYSPICFHFNSGENCKYASSSEEHLSNPKTSRESYLDLKLFIVVKKTFELFLVTHSL